MKQRICQNIDDVGFPKAVVNQIASMSVIDHSRAYITDLSNGGFMSHRVACEVADVFTAAAPVSAPLNVDGPTTCRPARPITVVHFHGLNDTIISYDGSFGIESAPDSLTSWRTIDGCTRSATVLNLGGSSRCETFKTYNDGAEAGLCNLDGTHILYSSQSAEHRRLCVGQCVQSSHAFTVGSGRRRHIGYGRQLCNDCEP